MKAGTFTHLWPAVLLLTAQLALAQAYPSHPIRVIVPFSPGSATDILARLIGPKLTESWGQQVITDNRPSAGGTVAGGIVAAAAPDGHTLLLTSSAFAGSAALYEKLPYDTVKDFAGVTQIASTPVLLVAAAGIGVKSVKDLIALAKQKPGQIAYGSSGIGSGTHFAAELFNLTAGISVVHVPYRGSPEVLNDVIAGRLQFAMTPVLVAVPLVRSGRVLAIGVTSTQRLPMVQDVPPIAEGLPGFEYDGWFGALAPARTPRAIVNKLSREIGRILQLPDVIERITSTGALPRSSTPEEFDKLVRTEIAMRTKVFKAAGAKAE
ncbi:MAG TPA: tripartite tricarboxylate transporter substrate binding protein [Burkholderiales bacterium]|nr:tripartite tricarboxylate transporter substrate binding protein [Burkholderiales bacterium]